MQWMTRGLLVGVMLLAGEAWAENRKPAPPASQLPPAKLGLWLDGIHKRDGHPDEQANIHHFCKAPTTGPIQCALFDGFGEDAKLVGIEYIIDEKTFASLPEAEKKLWHSHVYEVTSGVLVAPGMSEADETGFLKKAISTYGKTWHTWDSMLSQEVPMGRPELMMALTGDGQVKQELVQKRDAVLGTNTGQLRASRAQSITAIPKVLPGADQGEGGMSCKPNAQAPKARSGQGHR